MPLKRYSGIPSLQGLSAYTLRHLTSWIPKGFRWFAFQSDRDDWELGKLLRALAWTLARAKQDIVRLRHSIFLSAVSGGQLVATREVLEIEPLPGETEDELATRIANEFTADKLTATALELMVELMTDERFGGDIHEPPQFIMYTDSPLDGFYGLTSTRYFHGGVFELRVSRPHPGLKSYTRRFKATGTLPIWVVAADDNQFDLNDPDVVPGTAVIGAELLISQEAEVQVYADVEVEGAEHLMMREGRTGPGLIMPNDMPVWTGALDHNLLLVENDDQWAQTGVPVYDVLRTPYFDVRDPTDFQPGMDYAVTGASLGDGSLLGDPGLELG